MLPTRPPQESSPPALAAARRAREIAGDEAAGGDDARRDAFAALLYGFALAFESRATDPAADDAQPADAAATADADGDGSAAPSDTRPPFAERVGDLAVMLMRQVLGVGFRDACRSVEAIGESLATAADPAVAGLVHAGAAAAADWIDGERGAFEARVMQATADDAFASARALRPR